MSKAHAAPRNYVRQHAIKVHAVERFREYGTEITRASTDNELKDVLDEMLVEGLRDNTGEALLDSEREPCLLIPITREYWATPGLFMLTYDDLGSAIKKHVRTILITTAVQDMKLKGKLVNRMWSPKLETSVSTALTAALPQENAQNGILAPAKIENYVAALVHLTEPSVAFEKPSKGKEPVKLTVPTVEELQKQLELAQSEINKLTYDLTKATKKVSSVKEIQEQLDASKRDVEHQAVRLKTYQEEVTKLKADNAQLVQRAYEVAAERKASEGQRNQPQAHQPASRREWELEARLDQMERVLQQLAGSMLESRK
jgi:hypothetical protein